MKRRVHLIEWLDAEAHAEWTNIKELLDKDAPTCITLGVIVEEDKRRVIVAATLSEDDVNQYMTIPAGMVVRKKAIATVEIPSRLCPKKSGEPTHSSPTRKTKKAPKETTSLLPETTWPIKNPTSFT